MLKIIVVRKEFIEASWRNGRKSKEVTWARNGAGWNWVAGHEIQNHFHLDEDKIKVNAFMLLQKVNKNVCLPRVPGRLPPYIWPSGPMTG